MKTDHHSRRDFMNVTGAGVAGLVGARWLGASAPRKPRSRPPPGARITDLVVINAVVYTVDARAPRAEAFAVTAGRFSAVGSTAEMKTLAGKHAQVFDASSFATRL